MPKKKLPLPPPARRPRADAQRNRERILEVAKEAFTRAAASLDDIARRAGIGPGTLYRHFPARDALIEAVYGTEVEKLAAAEQRFAATMPPLEGLRAWMLLFIEHVGAYSAESERGFHVIVNSRCVSGAEDTDMGPSVHDDIGDGRIRAMPCSDSQPTRNVSVAGFRAGGAGCNYANCPAWCARLQKRYGGRHTANCGQLTGRRGCSKRPFAACGRLTTGNGKIANPGENSPHIDGTEKHILERAHHGNSNELSPLRW